MPYIEKQDRNNYLGSLKEITYNLECGKWSPGEVNYVIYSILLAWWKHEPRYKTICSIMGTLSCVAQEFYRKVASGYEDKAIEKNGDVT